MPAADTVFAGSIPGIYDRYMVPLLFSPYAAVVAGRARALNPARILETAAGTGVVTAALHDALPDSDIVATDLNPPMLDVAASRIRSRKVRFEQADAQSLPFADASFDLVVCQFGIMFVPDKVAANAEARRVLAQGGRYLLVVWDRVERNLATSAVGEAVAQLFPDDSATFYDRIPFRYHDPAIIEHDLLAAGFDDIAFETVALRSRARSAAEAAKGLCQGSPMRTEIEKLGPGALERSTEAAEQALRRFEGPDGFDAPMSAHLVVATR
ncbi:MAG TPA: class I SAM-dependent methyltransferase [Sphingomicrobium sp.]|nr:class I SAM-dependent methyltransferase [Sphingomicrobium sp.]